MGGPRLPMQDGIHWLYSTTVARTSVRRGVVERQQGDRYTCRETRIIRQGWKKCPESHFYTSVSHILGNILRHGRFISDEGDHRRFTRSRDEMRAHLDGTLEFETLVAHSPFKELLKDFAPPPLWNTVFQCFRMFF